MDKYKVVNGTYYHKETADEVVEVLERVRSRHLRVRLHYGYTLPEDDKPAGRDWYEEWNVTGYIGRSMGPVKIPLLIYNSRSHGGGGILDHCIVKIRTSNGGKQLYCHRKYSHGDVTIKDINIDEKGPIYTTAICIDGKVHARFITRGMARRYLCKMGLHLSS